MHVHMAQVNKFVLAAGLFCATALATSHPDFDLDKLAEEYPGLQRGISKYGRHLRHSGPRSPVLLKYKHNVGHRHSVHHRHHTSLEERLESDLADLPMALPGRHPSVEKALDGMAGDLENLKTQKTAAKEARSQLESTVTDTFHHSNDAMGIKRAIAQKQSQLRFQSGKLETLEKDAGRLEQTREGLMSSLRRMLEPKIMFARERFEKKERVLRKEEEAAKQWKAKMDQVKVSAMEHIKQKKSSYQSLLEAEAEVANAKKKEQLARIQYQHDAADTAEHVQSYRYAETRFKAEMQHEEAAKRAAMAAQDSVQNLYNVANVEEQKVDQSILYRKERLRQTIEKVEVAREKSNEDLSDLSTKYKQWKDQQRERTAEVIKKSQETAAASGAYADRQQQVLQTAAAKASKAAEAATDWDGWGNDFTKTTDEDDD